MINARVETVADKPAFRKAFAARRCLLPADGFYEWYAIEAPPDSRRSKPRKQPFFIHRFDGQPLVMAGHLRNLARPDQGPRRRLGLAADLLGDHHPGHRCGRSHPRPDADGGPAGRGGCLAGSRPDRPAGVRELLAVTEAESLEAYAVSTEVNSVQNNHPSLLEPITPRRP